MQIKVTYKHKEYLLRRYSKCTIKDAFKHYGIDTTSKKVSLCRRGNVLYYPANETTELNDGDACLAE